ncbi:hypothetical protein HAX54_029280, partial [Datura stramonium]|nr:hypothetical protein [Datura stramonium]
LILGTFEMLQTCGLRDVTDLWTYVLGCRSWCWSYRSYCTIVLPEFGLVSPIVQL